MQIFFYFLIKYAKIILVIKNKNQKMGRKRKKRRYQEEYYSLSHETKKGILIIALFAISLIVILSFLNLAGTAGIYIDKMFGIVFGWGRYFLPIILAGIGYVLARPNKYEISIANYIGLFLFFLSFHGLLHIRIPFKHSYELAFSGLGGGLVGFGVNYFLLMYLGVWASLIILIAIIVTSVLLTFNTSIETIIEKTNIFKFLSPAFRKNRDSEEDGENDEEDEDEEDDEEEEDEDEIDEETKSVESLPQEQLAFSSKSVKEQKTERTKIKTPRINIDLPIELLDDKSSQPTSGDIKLGQERIQKTLENFNIPVEMGDVKVGPTVTQYTLKPSEGIKLSRITSLNNDLALSLAAHPIRIEAPIPGKSLVGIEVPNKRPAIVRIREVLEDKSFKKRDANLYIALGKDVSGKCWNYNLAKMPHLLVAGATGSGKSVCLNSIIISLLYQNNPEDLRFIFVDPKRVELPVYNGIPHLLTPVITDVTKTVYALRWAITEMDQRFDELAKYKHRNIESYNKTAKEKMPNIVIIIDELADLMVAAAAEVEACIIRLTQMARAVGIHLVVATQRPSVDVITGLIKANIPSRIAFSVASVMDSRTILDSAGAEKLVGKGDMLFTAPDSSAPRRIQGNFVSDDEIKRVVDFLKDATDGDVDYNDEIVNKSGSNGGSNFEFKDNADDELFEEAKEIVIKAGKASASLLQRRLRVGYARAARLIDLLEDNGIVGPSEGAKPREILIDRVNALASQQSKLEEIEEEIEDEDIGNDEHEESIENEEDDDDNEYEEDDDNEDAEYKDEEDDLDEETDDEDKTPSPKKKSNEDEIY